ncbi:endonuclease domain-containing protein [Mucilaginibacter terrae]|uniref:Very-short-patch-repair endonuclease n=1 Tax=Mucilaginibacter terrae TaxID=1955052 RepID=A0ABU3GYL3_9SPHI|nr:endonuclease domain-containing protein [Mucilaginibacter terrae]MDT3404858.1 very-short-patch-repair endonuclease [Mucilaginibacter terrae]
MPRKIIPYKAHLKELARQLRNNSTPAEIKLWQELRNKQFHNYDFQRQKPLLNYIVDFYCAELDLVIEIDGRYHEGISEADAQRDAELGIYNLTVIRFSEFEVINDMFNVLKTLEAYLEEFKSRV